MEKREKKNLRKVPSPTVGFRLEPSVSLTRKHFLSLSLCIFNFYLGKKVMARRKIQIKKIENITARQVTFSKRRKGVFKKAQELSTLCDAEIALIVFSASGRFFEFASSSVEGVIEKRILHSEVQDKLDQPSTELQLELRNYAILSKLLEEKTQELRRLNGEELQELTLKELEKLEALLKRCWTRVTKAKIELVFQTERLLTEISTLKMKGGKLREENGRFKQVMALAGCSDSFSVIRKVSHFTNGIYFRFRSLNMNKTDYMMHLLDWGYHLISDNSSHMLEIN